jgi:hypothetical protein
MKLIELGKAPLLIAVGVLLGIASAKADRSDLSGKWVLLDGEGVLVIRGSDWEHPKYGSASIKKGTGAADYDVFYHKHQGVHCAYRVMKIADGEILVLEAADATQAGEYCPVGKLSRVSK